MLLMAMLSFHRNLNRTLVASQQRDFHAAYYTFASLIGILFVVNLAVLLLPGSAMTLNVSRLAFVAQGFAIHWLWFYMGFAGRQTNRATTFALVVAAAYTCALVWPWEVNNGKFNICPLSLPNKSAVPLFAAVSLMLGVVTWAAFQRREASAKPLQCYTAFLLFVFVIQAGGGALVVFASVDGGLCIFNFSQLLYAAAFPAVLYTVMEWDSKMIAEEKRLDVLSPLIAHHKGDEPVTGAAIRLYELLQNVHVCKGVDTGTKIGEGAFGQVQSIHSTVY
jgi:hypothetical protein